MDRKIDPKGVDGRWRYLSPLTELRWNGAHLGGEVAVHGGGTSGTHGSIVHQREGDSKSLGVTVKVTGAKEVYSIERRR